MTEIFGLRVAADPGMRAGFVSVFDAQKREALRYNANAFQWQPNGRVAVQVQRFPGAGRLVEVVANPITLRRLMTAYQRKREEPPDESPTPPH